LDEYIEITQKIHKFTNAPDGTPLLSGTGREKLIFLFLPFDFTGHLLAMIGRYFGRKI